MAGGALPDMLDWIERVGNRIPNAVMLFLWLSLAIILISVAASGFGLSVLHPGTGETVKAQNLLQAEFIRRLLMEMPTTFATFPPLGTVLTVMMGVGLAERSGLISAALGGLIRRVRPGLLPLVTVFVGIMSSIASDAGFIILPPLAAAIYAAVGRHPVAGIAAAFAGVSGGYSANLFITGLDPLLVGITELAGRMLQPGLSLPATANWFLMAGLVPLFSIVGAFISMRIVEPRLGTWHPDADFQPMSLGAADATTSRALARTGWAGLAIVAAILLLTVPEGAILRDPATGTLEPFFRSVVAILAISFAILGLVYGRAMGTIQSSDDAIRLVEETIASMALYIILAFVAAHFLALFAWSNLGILLAVSGADVLKATGAGPVPLVVGIVILSAFVNLFIGSASAKWALLAPIFVPMFMLVGIAPEITQGAYRVGDSVTNIITPMMVYFPLILVFAARYVPHFSIGSMIATMLPYSIGFFLAGTTLLILFVVSGTPFGPGVGLLSSPG